MSETTPTVPDVLDRPLDQRLREYKYRFAQTMVFGLPVLGLQWFGPSLGGSADGPRWSAIFQLLLTGWVLYIAATGMLFEGAMILIDRRRITAAFVVAVFATVACLFSALSVVRLVASGRWWITPPIFHLVILLLAIWCGAQWFRLSRRVNPTEHVP